MKQSILPYLILLVTALSTFAQIDSVEVNQTTNSFLILANKKTDRTVHLREGSNIALVKSAEDGEKREKLIGTFLIGEDTISILNKGDVALSDIQTIGYMPTGRTALGTTLAISGTTLALFSIIKITQLDNKYPDPDDVDKLLYGFLYGFSLGIGGAIGITGIAILSTKIYAKNDKWDYHIKNL